MKVRATKNGYFIKLREVGDVFDVEDKAQLGSWMEVLEEEKPKRAAKKAEPPSEPAPEDDFLD
jgi:hypothetical protein